MKLFTHPNLTISKTELFDINMAKYIISTYDIDNQDKKKIQQMIKKKERGNSLTINYILGRKAKQYKYDDRYWGRLVPYGNYGLQTLHKDIRCALSMKYYWDVDIKNCHGILLNQIAEKEGWVHTYLNELCENREQIFKNIMDSDNRMTRDSIKVLFLSLFYGGDYHGNNQWINDNFYPEIKLIMNNLSLMYPDVLKNCKKSNPDNPIGSCCSLILQDLECNILLGLDEYFTQNNRSMDVLIHDGGLIRKLKDETEFPKTLLKGAESFILKHFNYKIELVIKPMETTFKEPEKINMDKQYTTIKSNFEKEIFLCKNDACYYKVNNENITRFSKQDLTTAYEEVKYQDIVEGSIVEESFLKKWFVDETKRKYERVDFILPPEIVPDNVFNLWNGFEIERITNDDDERYGKDVETINNHIRLLCGNDEKLYDYILKWIANIFQNANEKNNIAVLFKSSQQGMGKNLFFELLRNMIGYRYACCIDKPERDIFGDFNSIMDNKLLVLMDEFAGRVGFKYDDEIKQLITCDTIDITQKKKDTITRRSYTKYIFNTNNDFPVRISLGERRFIICDSSKCNVPSKEYFDDLVRIKNNKPSLKAFYNQLMKIDLTKIDWIRDRPETESYNDIKQVSMSPETRFILGIVEGCGDTETINITAKNLYDKYMDFCLRDGFEYKSNIIKFGIKMKNIKIDGIEKKLDTHKKAIYVFNCKMIKEWFIKNDLYGDYGSNVRLLKTDESDGE